MRRLTTAALTSALALALAACGSGTSGTFEDENGETGSYQVDRDGDETTATVKTADGTMRMRSGADVPVDLPRGFSIYPGATIISNTTFDGEQGKGALVSIESSDAAAELVDFYKGQAEKAGVDIEMEMTAGDMSMIGGRTDGGTTFSFTATREEAKTTGQLMVGEDMTGNMGG